MLNLEKKLVELAGEEANAYYEQRYPFQAEKADLERRLMVVTTILEEMHAAPGRVASYKPKFSLMEYQCPKCWVREEREAHLVEARESWSHSCPDCHTTYKLPTG